jgi:hypothetical protein
MFYLFLTYAVANALCCKCFMSRRGKGGAGKGGTLRRSCPHMRVGSEAGATASAKYKVVSMGVAAGAEHETVFMGGQKARSTKLHP